MVDPRQICDRCGGKGIIPRYSAYDNGICFKCKGAGITEHTFNDYHESDLKEYQSKLNEKVESQMITKEQQMQIFNILVLLSKEKEASNPNGKQTFNLNQIVKKMEERGMQPSRLIVRGILDVLIKHKLVSYWKNNAKVMFFTITKEGWERWNTRDSKESA